jgi:hypothetical protein
MSAGNATAQSEKGSGDHDFRLRGLTWWSFVLRTYEQIQHARQ